MSVTALTCPNCGAPVTPGARVSTCAYCGATLANEAAPAPGAGVRGPVAGPAHGGPVGDGLQDVILQNAGPGPRIVAAVHEVSGLPVPVCQQILSGHPKVVRKLTPAQAANLVQRLTALGVSAHAAPAREPGDPGPRGPGGPGFGPGPRGPGGPGFGPRGPGRR